MAAYTLVGGTHTFQKGQKTYTLGQKVELTDAELMSAVKAGVRFKETEPKEGAADLPRHLLLAAKHGDESATAVVEALAEPTSTVPSPPA